MTDRLPGYEPDHGGPVYLGEHFHAVVEGVAVAAVSHSGEPPAPRVVLVARITPEGPRVEIVLEPEDTAALAAMAHEAGVMRSAG